MESMEDQRGVIQGLNVRLKGFLEHMDRLQETNMRLEGQIADWGLRKGAVLRDWSREENTVNGLRAQVSQMLVENAQLALESDSMKSRAAAIQARCACEERQTQRLEQQVALLRETKRRAEETTGQLEADLCHSMTELQDMKQEFNQACWSLQQQQQQQQSGSGDALLARGLWDAPLALTATTAAGAEEDGRGMELTQLLDQFRAQCGQPGPGEGTPGPGAVSTPAPGSTGPAGSGGARAAASSSSSSVAQTNGGAFPEEEAAWVQVNLGGAALREARAELTQARKQWRSLQVEMETLHALEKGLEGSLMQTQQLYSSQLQDLSQVIGRLESELEQVRGGLAGQRQRHRLLLNTKMRLEREIATYRRLLDREEGRCMVRNGQAVSLQPWRGPPEDPQENGLENGLSDPLLNDPALNDPALNDHALNDHALNDPALNDPTLHVPALKDAALSDPVLSDPGLSDPSLSDPALSDPGLSDPGLSDPSLRDPALSDPAYSDPGLSDPALSPDEPKSEPLPDIPPLVPLDPRRKKSSMLHRQQSLVILTEPDLDSKLQISMVKTQEILQGNVVQESAEGHGTVETEKIDQVIKQWEGSFFKGNPKLRKKSVSLRFDLHMAAADEGCAQTKQDSLPDVEVRLVMRRSRSIPSIT